MLACWCCWVAAGSCGTFFLEACRHPGAATPRLGILPAAEPRHVEVTSPWSSSTDSPHFRVLIQVSENCLLVFMLVLLMNLEWKWWFISPTLLSHVSVCLLQTMEASWAWINPKEKASFWHNYVQLDVLIKRKGQKSTLWLLFFFFFPSLCLKSCAPAHFMCFKWITRKNALSLPLLLWSQIHKENFWKMSLPPVQARLSLDTWNHLPDCV